MPDWRGWLNNRVSSCPVILVVGMATCRRATSAHTPPIAACIPVLGPPLRTALVGGLQGRVTAMLAGQQTTLARVIRLAKRSVKGLGERSVSQA